MTNILITGGCGFIGSHCVRHFYRTHPEYSIVNLDLLTYAGNPENLTDIVQEDATLPEEKRRYHFEKGSINDAAFILSLCEKYNFDMIINFAAETHVDRSIISMSDFITTNINGARALMETVRTHRVPKFIHISTDEVYGTVPHGSSSEYAPLRPSNPYSSSKAAADLIIQSFITTHAIPAIIIRGSNNYGTFQYPEKLIPLTITNLLEGKKIPVHGNGMHVRSWLHVQDFCDAIDLIAHHGIVSNVYNVAGEERTNLQILQLIAQCLDMSLTDRLEHIKDRPGADTRYAPDATKLREELGWGLKRNLQRAMPQIVDWYLKNPVWWQHIKAKKEYRDHYERQATGQWY